jgi:hypothetical protein
MKTSFIVALAALAGLSVAQAETVLKKWHPGFYFEAYVANMPDGKWQRRVVASGMQGAMFRFKWRDLETARGRYDFSVVRTVVERAKASGKYVGLHIEDRSWGNEKDEGNCVPDYLQTPEFGGGQMTRAKPNGGLWCTLTRWHPAAMDRYIALHQALAKEFDGQPNLVWVQTTESATSMGPQLTPEFRAALPAQYLRLADALGATWRSTAWGMSLNWDTGDLRTLIERIRAAGGGLTWPDTTPTACSKCVKMPLYDLLPVYKGTMPIVPTIEFSNLTGKYHPLRDKWDCGGHPCTWQDVHDQTMAWGAQMVQWQPAGWGEKPETNFNFERDLEPILSKINWQSTTVCPSNIRCK